MSDDNPTRRGASERSNDFDSERSSRNQHEKREQNGWSRDAGPGDRYHQREQHNRRGGWQDRRGGWQDRRGGWQDRRSDDRRGGRDGRRGGWQDRRSDDRRGGRDDRRGGWQDRRSGDRRGGRDDRRGGWQDRRSDDRRGGRDDRRGGWQDRRSGDRRGGWKERGGRQRRRQEEKVRPGFGGDRRPDRFDQRRDNRTENTEQLNEEYQAEKPENIVNEERRAGDPVIPEGITPDLLDPAVRKHLLSLRKEVADFVACQLVMAGMLLDTDPEAAHQHAMAAQRRAARVGIVREALALTAYHTGAWSLALREIQAFRRLTGTNAHEVIAADCERGRGNPERALELIGEVKRSELTDDFRAELAMVESGAHADLAEFEAGLDAVRAELAREHTDETRARLLSVAADRLRELGEDDKAANMANEAAELSPAGLEDGESLDDDLKIVEDE